MGRGARRVAASSNSLLELTRGPFLGTGKANCMASRRVHFAPSEALVRQRAAGGRPGWPARSSARGVGQTRQFCSRTKASFSTSR